MSITDELREWMGSHTSMALIIGQQDVGEFYAIADRIDAEHKAKVDEAYENGERDERADWLDETDGGYVKLPVDADGVIIHVGDVMEERSGHTFEVASLMAFGGSDNWLVLSDARNFSSFREPHDLRHVQPDSWERIIEDAQEYVTDDEPLYSVSELVERCRRLAGEA